MKTKAFFLAQIDRAIGTKCKYFAIKSLFYDYTMTEIRFVENQYFKKTREYYERVLNDNLSFGHGKILTFAFGDSMGEIEEYLEAEQQGRITSQSSIFRIGDIIKVIDENCEYNTYKVYIEYLIEWFKFPKTIMDKFAIKELEKGEVGQVVFIGRHLTFDCPIILIKTQHGYNLIKESGVERIE